MEHAQEDIITSTHLTLVLGADNSASDKFISHINTNPDLYAQITTASDEKQTSWMILYWEQQLNSCGLDGSLFSKWCTDNNIVTRDAFVRYLAQFFCTAVMDNDLPDTRLPLPPLN